MTENEHRNREKRLAFGWHAIETSLVGLLFVVALIGLKWSKDRLPIKTAVEINRARANERYRKRNP